MAAKDIRRDTQDIEPSIFVRPGVQNNALAEAITGVGGSLISLDASLAKERLGKQLDQARSEFLVGEVQDQSAGNDPELQAQLDQELAPFKKQLGSMSNAQRQGLLRGDRFKMQADAILQAQIAARPGLAPEFREIHAQYTGGAIIETIMRQEQEQLDAALRGNKDKADTTEKNRMFQLNAMKEAGFAAEAGSMAYSTPEEVNAAYMRLYPQISRQERTIHDAQVLKAGADGVEAGYALDRPASLQTWQGGYDLAMEGMLKTLRESGPMLATADENTFAGMVGEWAGKIAQVKSNLESTRTRLGLKPDDVAAQMQIFADLEKQGASLLDGTIEMTERKRRAESFKLRLEATMQKDQPLLASLTTLEAQGAHNTVKFMYDNNPQLGRQVGEQMQEFIIKGAGDPAVVAPLAGGFSQNLLKDMFPDGSQTKNPNIDIAAASKLLADFGKAFIVTPNDQLKVKPYAEWIEELGAFTEPLTKLLDKQQKGDLAESVRISARKVLYVGTLSLFKNYPQLQKQVVWNVQPGDEPLKYTGDDPVMERVVDQANQQLAWGNVTRLLRSLGDYPDEGAAHRHILESSDELMGQENLGRLKAQERAAKPAEGGGGSGSPYQPGDESVDTDTGKKYRFKGGDWQDPTSWEEIQ